MKKQQLTTLAAALLALGVGTAQAATPFGDLCGTLVTVDTEVKDSTETLNDTCEITVASGVKLELKGNNITVASDNLEINGTADASLEMNNNIFDVDDDFIIAFESGDVELMANTITAGDDFTLSTDDGKIELAANKGKKQKSPYQSIVTGEDIDISSVSGDIEIKGTVNDSIITTGSGHDVNFHTDTGNIEVKDSVIEANDIRITSNEGKIEVKDNVGYDSYLVGIQTLQHVTSGDGELTITSDTGSVEVKDNTTDIDGSVDIDGVPCEVKDNTDSGTPLACS